MAPRKLNRVRCILDLDGNHASDFEGRQRVPSGDVVTRHRVDAVATDCVSRNDATICLRFERDAEAICLMG